MSHIQRVGRANGKRRYRARWVDEDGAERSRTFSYKWQAEDFLATLVEPEEVSTWIEPGVFVVVCADCDFRDASTDNVLRDHLSATHVETTGHQVVHARGSERDE